MAKRCTLSVYPTSARACVYLFLPHYDHLADGIERLHVLSNREIARLQREEPTSHHNFVFIVATADAELRIDPGGRDEFRRWQDALLLAVTLPVTASPELPVAYRSDQKT
eukprot:2940256-Pleurochrysis_carterae.AAC.1